MGRSSPGTAASSPPICADQGLGTPKSLEEMYEIYRQTGAHVHIAHFKASGRAAWGHAAEYIENVHEAQKAGIHVTADVYPYTAYFLRHHQFVPQMVNPGRKADGRANAKG